MKSSIHTLLKVSSKQLSKYLEVANETLETNHIQFTLGRVQNSNADGMNGLKMERGAREFCGVRNNHSSIASVKNQFMAHVHDLEQITFSVFDIIIISIHCGRPHAAAGC